jgi:hypothetical protein
VPDRKPLENERGEGRDDPGLQLLYDHVKLTFVANARNIAESQKPEALLKMIQACKEIQPVDHSNQELWRIVQKVRKEILGGKVGADKKVDPPKRRRRRS